jgi:hypothetical protein
VIARVALPESGEFALRYRNSLYRSIAEERFNVTDDGRIMLTALAADELAVLEEYYAIDEPAIEAGGGARQWVAPPAQTVELRSLRVAALLVKGHPPMELWRFVDDADPSVLLEVE